MRDQKTYDFSDLCTITITKIKTMIKTLRFNIELRGLNVES